MSALERLEGALVQGAVAGFRALGWRRSLVAGSALGELARRLGVRAQVARANLAHAFPELDAVARETILTRHYHELGRVVAEYARLAALARSTLGEAIAEFRGMEHIERVRAAGRGAILMSGHFGNFELLATCVAQRVPLEMVTRPLSNKHVEAWVAGERERAGTGSISADVSARTIYRELRANRMIAMLGDQDARGSGVFVPFLGRAASTAAGPARIALATGVPIIMGFITRRPDGRHDIEIEPPIPLPERGDPASVVTLTARHTARLELRVRARPELWFWLHRRWKTEPPAPLRAAAEEARRAFV